MKNIIIPLYVLINMAFFVYLVSLCLYCDVNWLFFAPSNLYKITNMNWIGCYICSLCIIILLPLYCIPVTIIWLIYWLFHI